MGGRNEKPLLAVLSSDRAYAWRLAEYMNEKSGFPMQACPFTDTEKLLEQMRGEQTCAVLGDASLLTGLQETAEGTTCLCIPLLEEMPEGAERERNGRGILKFQPARRVIDQVMAYLAEGSVDIRSAKSSQSDMVLCDRDDEQTLRGTQGLPFVRELPAGSMPPDTELIGIYSPVGRCGKTTFALTLGEILGETRRTLYLDMDRYSGMKEMGLMEEAAEDLNDLLYYHQIDPGSLVYRIGRMVRTFKNLDYISSPLYGEDVMAVRAVQWLDMFAALAGAGEYRALILDMGNALEEVLPILSACDTIYMPVVEDRICMAKVRQFFQAADKMGMGAVTDKVRQLHLPLVREESQGRDVPARLARGKMGAYVRKLL